MRQLLFQYYRSPGYFCEVEIFTNFAIRPKVAKFSALKIIFNQIANFTTELKFILRRGLCVKMAAHSVGSLSRLRALMGANAQPLAGYIIPTDDQHQVGYAIKCVYVVSL